MRAKLKDYKDWIQERAEEIAWEEDGEEFCDLLPLARQEIYQQAQQDHTDAYSAWGDAIYERIRGEEMKWNI